MYYVSEYAVRESVEQSAVNEAVKDVFVAMAGNSAVNFPVVRETRNIRYDRAR